MPPRPKTGNSGDAPAGKRFPLNMRTTGETRSQIEAAARASGRSLVQEVEYRLERSFRDQSVVDEMLGGQKTSELLQALSLVIRLVELRRGKKWHDDAATWFLTCTAINRLLDDLRPAHMAIDNLGVSSAMMEALREVDLAHKAAAAVASTMSSPPESKGDRETST